MRFEWNYHRRSLSISVSIFGPFWNYGERVFTSFEVNAAMSAPPTIYVYVFISLRYVGHKLSQQMLDIDVCSGELMHFYSCNLHIFG